jgi:microcystin-dependent protein
MTTNKTNLQQPAYNSSSWNAPLNSNFGIIDNSFGATTAISLSGSNYALLTTDVQAMRIAASGVLLANVLLLIPAGVTGFWIISNATSGGYTLGVYSNNGAGGAAGAGVGVGQGYSSIVYSDGTNVYLADSNFSAQSTPPGTIMQFAMSSVPSGYLIADGTAYSRSAYAALFSAIGTSWGAGDGSTTFNVPDLRGAFLRGSGAGLNPSSRAVASYQSDAYGTHTHAVTDPGHSHTAAGAYSGAIGGGSIPIAVALPTTVTTSTSVTGISIQNSGDVETRPKNFAVLYGIKT